MLMIIHGLCLLQVHSPSFRVTLLTNERSGASRMAFVYHFGPNTNDPCKINMRQSKRATATCLSTHIGYICIFFQLGQSTPQINYKVYFSAKFVSKSNSGVQLTGSAQEMFLLIGGEEKNTNEQLIMHQAASLDYRQKNKINEMVNDCTAKVSCKKKNPIFARILL